jgi:hypothetical protein
MFVDTIDRQVAETMVGYLQASDATIRVAQLRALVAMARCRPGRPRSHTAPAGSW